MPSLRGGIKVGHDADLCSMVTEVWFSQCTADWVCLLMGAISRTDKKVSCLMKIKKKNISSKNIR